MIAGLVEGVFAGCFDRLPVGRREFVFAFALAVLTLRLFVDEEVSSTIAHLIGVPIGYGLDRLDRLERKRATR